MIETITLEQAISHLNDWREAERAVSKSQSYSMGSRSLTRVNISEIRKQITYWENRIAAMTGRGRRSKRYVPRDL